jgi:integrase
MNKLRRKKPKDHPSQPRIDDALNVLLVRTARRAAAGVLSPRTLAMQQEHVRYLLERLPPGLPIGDITAELLEQLVAAEEKGRRVRADGQTRVLSGGTVRKRLSTLHQALELQLRKGAIDRIPIFPEIPYVYRPSKRRLPTHADYLRLLGALPAARAEWLALAVWTGQRHKDVEGAVREDFDPLAIDDDDQAAPSIVIRSSKTGRVDGIRIAAAPELLRVLTPRWRTLGPGDFLVEPWPHASSQLGDTCERIGLPRLTAHAMRHTFFTWYVQANGFTPELLELGGWSSLAMPAKVYAHAQPVRFREQIARTVEASHGPRRSASQQASRERVGNPLPPTVDSGGEKEVGPPVLIAPAAPNTCPGETRFGAGSERRSQAPEVQDSVSCSGARGVGAERIELSTNGLRARPK